MPASLFELAGPAILAWLILIFAPTSRPARWLGESAIGPLYLAILYLVGVAPLMVEGGLAVMRDFGTAEGVTRLLATQDVAMIAWIHILAFDQLVGVYIYRENMKHRYVSMPAQSVILFLTLMFGPAGFLTFYVLRWVRSGRPAGVARSAVRPPPGIATTADTLVSIRWLWRNERGLIATGLAGVVIGLVDFALIAQRGTSHVQLGGDLHKAAAFCLAVGIYILTLVPLLPASGVSRRMHNILIGWWVGAALYSFSIENIQIFRGLDPRFNGGSAVDQIAGGVFFLIALSLIVHFYLLTGRFLRAKHRVTHAPMLLAIRYGIVAVTLGFIGGIWMSSVQGRVVGVEGNLLPLHAIGFHGMQAIPAIALLLVWARIQLSAATRAVHIAGGAWLASTIAIAGQTALGRRVDSADAGSTLIVAFLAVWAAVGFWSLASWLRRLRPAPKLAVS